MTWSATRDGIIRHMSPHQEVIGDSIVWEPDDVPIAPAEELAVQLPDDDSPKADCYIDDMFSVFLGTRCHTRIPNGPICSALLGTTCSTTAKLSRETTCYPYQNSWPKQHQPNDSRYWVGFSIHDDSKLNYPKNKYIAWTQMIDKILQQERVTTRKWNRYWAD